MSDEVDDRKATTLVPRRANQPDQAGGCTTPVPGRSPVSPLSALSRRPSENAGENPGIDAPFARNASTAASAITCKHCGASVSLDRLAFRERLLEVVRELGSEAELERRAGLPVASLCHYTRKQSSEPSRPHLVRIALAAEVSIGWLAAGIGPKRASE